MKSGKWGLEDLKFVQSIKVSGEAGMKSRSAWLYNLPLLISTRYCQQRIKHRILLDDKKGALVSKQSCRDNFSEVFNTRTYTDSQLLTLNSLAVQSLAVSWFVSPSSYSWKPISWCIQFLVIPTSAGICDSNWALSSVILTLSWCYHWEGKNYDKIQVRNNSKEKKARQWSRQAQIVSMSSTKSLDGCHFNAPFWGSSAWPWKKGLPVFGSADLYSRLIRLHTSELHTASL